MSLAVTLGTAAGWPPSTTAMWRTTEQVVPARSGTPPLTALPPPQLGPCQTLGIIGKRVAIMRGSMQFFLLAVVLALAPRLAAAGETADVVCSFAPSQSKAAAAVSGAAGGSAAGVAAVAAATGTTVVAHSSGAFILTGSGGYIAGTLGTAIVGPTVVVVGLVVGGAAVSVELFCAPKNHPEQVAKIKLAAAEFGRRSKAAFAEAKTAAAPAISNVTISVKQVAGDVAAYASGRASK